MIYIPKTLKEEEQIIPGFGWKKLLYWSSTALIFFFFSDYYFQKYLLIYLVIVISGSIVLFFITDYSRNSYQNIIEYLNYLLSIKKYLKDYQSLKKQKYYYFRKDLREKSTQEIKKIKIEIKNL